MIDQPDPNSFEAPPISEVSMHSKNLGPVTEMFCRVMGEHETLCATVSSDLAADPNVSAAWRKLGEAIGSHLHNQLHPDNPIAHVINLSHTNEKLQ